MLNICGRAEDNAAETFAETFAEYNTSATPRKECVAMVIAAKAAINYDVAAKGIISDKSLWQQYSAPVTKAQAAAIIDKASGGMWTSPENDAAIHWAQPHIISLCGKGIISDKSQWLDTLDTNISKALLLALVDKATDVTPAQYVSRVTDHWGRNNLDSLCDKGIIVTPTAWTDFEADVPRGNTMALVCKAFKIN